MQELIFPLEQQLNYVKKLFLKRESFGEEPLTHSILPDEPAPVKIFRHAINNLHHMSYHKFSSSENLPPQKVEPSSKNSIPEQLIDEYTIAINAFSRFLEESDEELLNSVKDTIAYYVQHTIGHIGQAIRLHILYINHILKKKE